MAKIRTSKSVILHLIQERHIYKDERSEERGTGVVKRKYKLAGKWPSALRAQNVRIFFVSTSRELSNRMSVAISGADYESCSSSSLKEGVSYYDLRKNESLSAEEVVKKKEDPNNGFKDVAVITESAFEKFLTASKNLKLQGRPPISVQNIINISSSVASEEVSDKLLRELHIIK